MSTDPKGLAVAEAAARELRRGYDPEALLGTAIPVLVALAVEYLGPRAVADELRRMARELARGDG